MQGKNASEREREKEKKKTFIQRVRTKAIRYQNMMSEM